MRKTIAASTALGMFGEQPGGEHHDEQHDERTS